MDSEENLSEEEKSKLRELKLLDAEVKTHEQAHKAAASGLNTSAPSYETEKGPDGKEYAVAGEVAISFSETENAQENLEKSQKLKRAALAPAEPSSQDRAVAQKADALIRKFQQEINEDKKEEYSEEEALGKIINKFTPESKFSTEIEGESKKDKDSEQMIKNSEIKKTEPEDAKKEFISATTI